MKYIIILGDGMADYPLEQLGNKTPLEYAKKPTIDEMARYGELGLVQTLFKGMPTGSDIANLSVLGYDPKKYYTGRSPIEALDLGINLNDGDVTFRCNFVTISEDELLLANKKMLDHGADKISTQEAEILLDALKPHLQKDKNKFYTGVSYRHIMTWSDVDFDFELTPPHDIIGQVIKDYMPKGKYAEEFLNMMKKSYLVLKDHSINLERVKRGLKPANCIWLWGEGTKPKLDSFYSKFKLNGSMISAVPLLKGLGKGIGFRVVEVEGATGEINTNYLGKAQAAINELKNGQDIVFVHIEAPDECGHDGHVADKVKSIELIDEKIVKVIKEEVDKLGFDYKMMVLPDHATPISKRTHTIDPVPFLIYNNNEDTDIKFNEVVYDEHNASNTGLHIEEGYQLMSHFLSSAQ